MWYLCLLVIVLDTQLLAMYYQYQYPVGYDEKTDTIFYIFQKDPLQLELYAFNKGSQEYTKLLPSYLIPTGFRLLPSNDGFSFIHNDMIYMKKFSKRSPKRIEFFEPIYGINTIEWIDDTSFYFAAREHGHYRIYEGTIEGDLELIISNDTSDALYPQKINDQLFYIQRDSNNIYHIIQTTYKSQSPKKYIAQKRVPIACLSMLTKIRGFFLIYPSKIKAGDATITFSYYQISQNKEWNVEWLFDFSLPKEWLIDNEKRLYESIIPVLPKYRNEKLYFLDIYNDTVSFFTYDFSTKQVVQTKKNRTIFMKSLS